MNNLKKGYSENFLGAKMKVAVPLNYPDQGNSPKIDMMDYSVLFNKTLRQSWISMANIDGEKIKNARRRDSWNKYNQNDLPQLTGDDFYKRDPWDKGHLTSWKSMCWGNNGSMYIPQKPNSQNYFRKVLSKDYYKRASNTNFFINAAPQHNNFNRNEWCQVETAITDFAQEHGKIITYTGPVFTKYDMWFLPNNLLYPIGNAVRIPSAFWKMIFYERNSSLFSLAFLCYQNRSYLLAREYGVRTGKRKHQWLYLKSTDYINQITGINFARSIKTSNPVTKMNTYCLRKKRLYNKVLAVIKNSISENMKLQQGCKSGRWDAFP